MNLAELVIDTRVKENAFRKSRLSGIDVGHDTDIADFRDRRNATGIFLIIYVYFMFCHSFQ